ncbi:reverse transcriptase domain-containing protein [Tanacetum coccineum]
MLTDIKETFQRIRSSNMKLNPKKCSFSVEEGPFLGHLITKKGIRVNLSKLKAIVYTEQPKMLKDIQSLNGKLAALNRFLSKGAKRSLPFFKVLKSYTDKNNIQWTQEAAAALQEMKKFVETLPTLTGPIHGEFLMINKETPKDFLIEAPPEDNRKEIRRKTDTKLEEMKPSYPEGKECTYALRFEFETTNNEALLEVLRIAQEMEIVKLAIFVDSQLLVNQMKGIYAAKRNQKKKVDALIKLASMTLEHLTKEVLVEVLTRRSIEEKEVLQVETKEEESWMTPIHEYLLSSLLPEDSKVSRKIRIKAPQYKLIRGSLYKKSFYKPWLLCTYPPKTDDVIKEIHEDCEKRKEQSAVRKRAEILAIAAGNAWPLKHSMKWIEAKPLTTVLWIHKTLPRNNQKETPFSLTYGSEAIIPTVKSNVAKYDRGRMKEVKKRKENNDVASIEEAYYQNELRRYHSKRSNHSTYKVGDFFLLLQNNIENPQVWQGPHMIREVHEGELYKIIDAYDHSNSKGNKPS